MNGTPWPQWEIDRDRRRQCAAHATARDERSWIEAWIAHRPPRGLLHHESFRDVDGLRARGAGRLSCRGGGAGVGQRDLAKNILAFVRNAAVFDAPIEHIVAADRRTDRLAGESHASELGEAESGKPANQFSI